MDTSKKLPHNTTSEVPDSGTVAVTMGIYSIIFFVVLSTILTIIHNSLV